MRNFGSNLSITQPQLKFTDAYETNKRIFHLSIVFCVMPYVLIYPSVNRALGGVNIISLYKIVYKFVNFLQEGHPKYTAQFFRPIHILAIYKLTY